MSYWGLRSIPRKEGIKIRGLQGLGDKTRLFVYRRLHTFYVLLALASLSLLRFCARRSITLSKKTNCKKQQQVSVDRMGMT